jgi:hypothetical protein
MPIYGHPIEKQELKLITTRFKGRHIINPASYSNHPEKKKNVMEFCYRLIDGCDDLVFTRWQGIITSGVGQEVNYALNKGMKVLELMNEQFSPIRKHVAHLSYQDTRRMYMQYWYPFLYD